MQQTLSDLKHTNQSLIDQNARLQNELANNEVQRSALESQLRLSTWPPEGSTTKDEELLRQLQTVQRERSEMRGKVDALNDKVNVNDYTNIKIFSRKKERERERLKK